jgi:hypothetical protein
MAITIMLRYPAMRRANRLNAALALQAPAAGIDLDCHAAAPPSAAMNSRSQNHCDEVLVP